MTVKTIDPKTLSPAVRWLLDQGKSVSEIGELTADILGELYDGIYHVDGLDKVSFAGTYVEVPIHGSLSSYDWDHLTRLVVLAHDKCVRVAVSAKMLVSDDADYLGDAYPSLVLSFSKRERMERAAPHYWSSAHPTLEEAIAHVRSPRSIA